MTHTSHIPFRVDITRVIEVLAKQIYQSPLALLRENCQNAYDAILMRIHKGQQFAPCIELTIGVHELRIVDNGIGMTRADLENNYWRAGASGKNTPDARAAGVVGTFGVGAMANFGVADELEIVTESAVTGERTRSVAKKETLSANDECISLDSLPATGQAGTTVIARTAAASPINIAEAKNYIAEFVRYLEIPVGVNGENISGHDFEEQLQRPTEAVVERHQAVELGSGLSADVEVCIGSTGDVWIRAENFSRSNVPLRGTLVLRQNVHKVNAFRSRFGLAVAGVSSSFNFGGVADLIVFEPTAGREALTTGSVQLLQTAVNRLDTLAALMLAELPQADQSTLFMEWASRHNRVDLCGNLRVRIEPGGRTRKLSELAAQSKQRPINYYDGQETTLIEAYASEETPLIVASTRQPRRRCELSYLEKYVSANKVANAAQVISRKSEREWTLPEQAIALRLAGVLESDYFLEARVSYGQISHNLPLLVDSTVKPVDIVLDPGSGTVATILRLYDSDFASLSGMVKDFARSVIFPKIASLVPSSTRQGAEAFLRSIRKPREIFEYERDDLGSLTEIWNEYLSGKLSMTEAAQRSASYVRQNVQVVDRAATRSLASVIPDVIQNQATLDYTSPQEPADALDALPAISRLDQESPARVLTIEADEPPLKGYRCFVALSDRVREDRGDFFLQPHRTEIVWGGQKALYVFQHQSGEFGLYYDLQGAEPFASTSGGRAFPTCTIVLKNQIYIPVPEEIAAVFIPLEGTRKRFEVKCDLLYLDMADSSSRSQS